MKDHGTIYLLRRLAWVCLLIFVLEGCSILHSTSDIAEQRNQQADFSSSSKYGMLPLLNVSQTPMAAERVETILAALLRSKGIENLSVYPVLTKSSILDVLDNSKKIRLAKDWASKEDFQYLVTGSVEEWRYKSGLDGEPAVGITLQVLDAKSSKVLWTATGARSGWGREAASMTAHRLLSDLIDVLEIDEHR